MSGCVDGGALITDGVIEPPGFAFASHWGSASVEARRSARTYASTSSRCDAVSGARIARRAVGVVAARNCWATGNNDGASAAPASPEASHDCGIEDCDGTVPCPPTGGRSGAEAGFGSMATRTPLTAHTATAPAPLITLSARVLSVTARRFE